MGGKLCPNCGHAFLVRYGSKKRSRPQKRCRNCGYFELDSGNKLSGVLYPVPDFSEGFIRRAIKKELEEEQKKMKVLPKGYIEDLKEPERELTPQKKDEIRKSINHELGIQKILKEIRKNKYSGLKGKKLYFRGRDGVVRGYEV